jgi:hypothetical protein
MIDVYVLDNSVKTVKQAKTYGVYGIFAVNAQYFDDPERQKNCKKYTVTHVPSGYAVKVGLKLSVARKLAKCLQEQAPKAANVKDPEFAFLALSKVFKAITKDQKEGKLPWFAVS